MEPVESARKEDARHAVIMTLILLLIGFAGFVSLFLAQAYRSARSSLSKVRAFSDNLVENMPIGLLALDTEGKIASLNQAGESILGISFDDSFGNNAKNLLPHHLLASLDDLKSTGSVVTKEIDCPLSDGNVVPLDVSATTLHEENGAFMGHLVLFRDLTEIKALKKEIERGERLASIGRLASGVAHEIRNPLSSIKGFATYFRERYRDVPEDQATADIMIQEVERLNRVIGQLLEFARPLNIEKKPTSILNFLEHSLKLIEGDANKKGVSIEFTKSSETEEVNIDPDRVKQVLLNLYLNALDAMEKGGTLSIEPLIDADSGHIKIIISDSGKGINSEDLAHVFDPYFTTKSSGTGLGLAIVHNIVESHQGEVWIESKLGEGTKVTISLPLS
jgi:two-component system sensor histidine kinase HydH